MKVCAAVIHGRCIYLTCKGQKQCLRESGGQPPGWQPVRTPAKHRAKAKAK